jgi:hypothetical protein
LRQAETSGDWGLQAGFRSFRRGIAFFWRGIAFSSSFFLFLVVFLVVKDSVLDAGRRGIKVRMCANSAIRCARSSRLEVRAGFVSVGALP